VRKRLFISNIGVEVTDKDLYQAFKVFGDLESAYRVKVQSNSNKTNFGYITYKNEKNCTKAFELGTIYIKESSISIFRFKKNYKYGENPAGSDTTSKNNKQSAKKRSKKEIEQGSSKGNSPVLKRGIKNSNSKGNCQRQGNKA